MVLPETWAASVALIVISIICFGLWPSIFKLAGAKWRFELFSVDFALGTVVFALLAAFTLGTRGAELGFSDSMLVAGQRAEAVAVLAGAAFGLGNICYLGAVAVIGVSNATLLTFSVFGGGVALLQLGQGHDLRALLVVLILAAAAGLAIASGKARRVSQTAVAAGKPGNVRPTTVRSGSRSKKARPPVAPSTKGAITGILAGMAFVGILPSIQFSQPLEMGIGAYGGVLLASVGILVATVFLNFFFMKVSLQGGKINYGTYLGGTWKDHSIGVVGGAVWTAGALALYAAYTGGVKLTELQAWLGPFGGALVGVLTGMFVWQKSPQSSTSTRNMLIAAALFVIGVAVLLTGF